MVGEAGIEPARCPVPETGGRPLAHSPESIKQRHRYCLSRLFFTNRLHVRTRPESSRVRDASMTIRAPNFALGDLRLYRSDARAHENQRADVVALCASDVIELKDDDISLAAINTRMLRQVLVSPLSRATTRCQVPAPHSASSALARLVEFLSSIALTVPTFWLKAVAPTPMSVEVGVRLRLPALRTRLHGRAFYPEMAATKGLEPSDTRMRTGAGWPTT